MFNIFRKQNSGQGIITQLDVTTDIHSHVLPGIDDGSEDIATSIHLVQGLYELGYRKLIATPHVIGDFYRNNPEIIGNALATLQAACQNQGINIELSAAAEYMLDDYFLKLLKDKDQILTVQKNILLTELPYTVMPMNVDEMVFAIITAGYKPILAHPERYFYYHRSYDEYFKLKELGFLLQVNLLSLTGYYGPLVAKAAKFIFDNGLAEFVGTDMHHERHLAAIKNNVVMINKFLKGKPFNSFEMA